MIGHFGPFLQNENFRSENPLENTRDDMATSTQMSKGYFVNFKTEELDVESKELVVLISYQFRGKFI